MTRKATLLGGPRRYRKNRWLRWQDLTLRKTYRTRKANLERWQSALKLVTAIGGYEIASHRRLAWQIAVPRSGGGTRPLILVLLFSDQPPDDR